MASGLIPRLKRSPKQETGEPPSRVGALVRVLQLLPGSHDLKDDSCGCGEVGRKAAVRAGIAREGGGVLRDHPESSIAPYGVMDHPAWWSTNKSPGFGPASSAVITGLDSHQIKGSVAKFR